MADIEELEYKTECRVLNKIASGGMGDVYLAEQLGTHGFNKIVAIKTIRPEMLSNQTTLEMFISEAKLVAHLVHENIGHVYNLCNCDNVYFIVMEFIKGITLSKFLKTHKSKKVKVNPEMVAFIGSRIARALNYAHNKTDLDGVHLKIVHRDVTPANVMIDTLGVVKLTDFGIAKAVTGATPDEHKVLMGKYPYMSPEQVRLEGTDGRSDIFSLGLTLYELLMQKKLFPAKSREELLEMLDKEFIIPPHQEDENIKPELSNIVMSMLEIDPDKRVESARKIVIALEKYMYEGGYGPTNEKLARYIRHLFQH